MKNCFLKLPKGPQPLYAGYTPSHWCLVTQAHTLCPVSHLHRCPPWRGGVNSRNCKEYFINKSRHVVVSVQMAAGREAASVTSRAGTVGVSPDDPPTTQPPLSLSTYTSHANRWPSWEHLIRTNDRTSEVKRCSHQVTARPLVRYITYTTQGASLTHYNELKKK